MTRIERLRAALSEIFFLQPGRPMGDVFLIAKEALHADDALAHLQDEGQMSAAQAAIEAAAEEQRLREASPDELARTLGWTE